MQKPQFYYQPAVIGGRVYVSNDAPEAVHEWFKSISVWGGCDKSGENFRSYELKNEHDWIQY